MAVTALAAITSFEPQEGSFSIKIYWCYKKSGKPKTLKKFKSSKQKQVIIHKSYSYFKNTFIS